MDKLLLLFSKLDIESINCWTKKMDYPIKYALSKTTLRVCLSSYKILSNLGMFLETNDKLISILSIQSIR